MNLHKGVGIVVFLLVPLLLWLLAAATVKRKGFTARFFALIAGSDNRLSLSRLQAFAWTLVIFGSFAAAMTIHTKILAGSPAEKDKANTDAQAALKNVETVKTNAATAAAALKTATDAKNVADTVLREAQLREKALPNDAPAESKNSARRAVVEAEATAKVKVETKDAAEKAETEAKAAVENAQSEAKAAAALAKSYEWVEIPAALLALAGIAIGSGVFSSLISAVNSEDKTACVTSLGSISQADLKAHFPQASAPTNPNCLSIIGTDMGSSGSVRLNNRRVPILLWKSDGTQIIVDVRDNAEFNTLVVDTPNGKACYELAGKTPNLTLRLPKIYYEFADLFRDDKNPSGLDLMKFQMFGWTLIAIVIYVYLFLADFRTNLESLPVVPASIVILTGLSQSGYLTGKAVSNVSPNEKK